jgi:hypothetical protein
MADFVGFVPLEGQIVFAFQVSSSNVPADADALPTFRTYGKDGKLAGGEGTCGYRQSGEVTGATADSPIVITSAGHGLQTGMRVVTSSIGGVTGANGSFTVTRINADTFSLDGSTGGGSYTSGGSWHIAGLYTVTLDAEAADGFESGEMFTVYCTYSQSSSARAQVFTVGVT